MCDVIECGGDCVICESDGVTAIANLNSQQLNQ